MSRVDLRDLAGDAVAAVTALQRRDDIDPDQVGLWGHSQGGWVAPIAAALTDVAFVVSFSGPGVTYADLDKFANANRLRAHGFDGKDVETALSALERVDEYVRDGGDAEALQTFLDQSHASRWAGFTTLPRRVPTPEDMRSWVRWRNLDLDPVDYWKRLRAPVLLLYGERDDVVPVQESLRRIQAALAEAGNADVTVRVFPGGDHGIRQVEELPELMVAWILARVETVPE